MYNTKLTASQKEHRKILKGTFRETGGGLFNFEGFTVAIRPAFCGAHMSQVSVSVASPEESVLRRKVGEYHALLKMDHGQFMQVPVLSEDYEAFAESLAGFLGRYYS